MDPTACYLEMFEAMNDGDHELARQYCNDLRMWFSKGGYYPTNYSRAEVDAYVASVWRRTDHVKFMYA